MNVNLKKTILFIVPLPPPVHGSSIVSQIIKDSNKINDDFTCTFINLSTSRKINEIGKGSFIKIFRVIGALLRLLLALIKVRPEICYIAITCHGKGFLKDSLYVLLCKLFCTKIVLHQHNKGMSLYIDKPIYRWLLPLVYKNTHVILLSWKLYPDVEGVVKKEQVLICPNGIEKSNCGHISESQLHIIPRILFLSNLLVSKGVLVLLDVCALLKRDDIQFELRLVGGETNEIKALQLKIEIEKRGLVDRVIYMGAKYGQDKIDEFTSSDIFVLPTLDDCFPLTILEAMQYKKPVVSTDIGAIGEIIEDGKTGMICKANDSIDLFNKLSILLQDKKMRKEYGDAGYNRYLSLYTIDRFEDRLISILNKI